MSLTTLATWLHERTAFSVLDDAILADLCSVLDERVIPAQTFLVKADAFADGLYILQSGHLEEVPSTLNGVSFLPGAVLNLRPLLLNQRVEHTVITLTECRVWFVAAEAFQALLNRHPEILQVFSQQLVNTIRQLSSQLSFEQERQSILRPYLVAKARRGIVGKSRYAVRLRHQIRDAFADCQSVLIFGEPGLEKDNIAALIHFSSPCRQEPIIKVDCARVQASGADLFGRVGGKPSLLEALGRGTLVLNNVQELPEVLLPAVCRLLTTQTYVPVSRSEDVPEEEKQSQVRVILIAEKSIPRLEKAVGNVIKVPPLRVRKADLEDQVNYYASLICRARGIKPVHLTPEAIRRLQSYDFPNNLRELESLVARAIAQLEPGQSITDETIWPSQSKKKQFRWNLLNAYPQFRQFLRSPWWPDRINYGFTAATFAIVVAVLFLGPQTRDRNFALNLFWAWWWPLALLTFPIVGRLWCSVCPFMIYGEITQKLSLLLFPRTLKRWPRQQADQWGGWFLFSLFALILIWEEVWQLENTAYLSACLLLLITAGAMIFSAIFERRFWCRYLCPIGGMNGLFAKLSITELRAQQGICSAECTTYQCYKGGPAKGEGQATNGCPLYSHPAQLDDNRDCVLCMTCLKACPHRSVEFNLRPPGIELWTSHIPRTYEVALLFLLLNTVYLHHLPQIQARLQDLSGWSVDVTPLISHLGISILVLALPTLLPALAYAGVRLIHTLGHTPKPRSFAELAYGYLPLVLAANLAHYLKLGLGEAGRVLPVGFATFGLSGADLPILVTHPAVIVFLQGSTLIFGVLLSVILTQKIAKQSLALLLPQHLCSVVLGLSCGWVIVGH